MPDGMFRPWKVREKPLRIPHPAKRHLLPEGEEVGRMPQFPPLSMGQPDRHGYFNPFASMPTQRRSPKASSFSK